MLRAARLQRGLHIGVLAASIKVPQARLEALESERYQDLLDATFARALALSVCRALKIDPEPVLVCLPGTNHAGLDRDDRGLNTPFRERPGRIAPANWIVWRQQSFWVVALLLVAAAGVAFMPIGWWRDLSWPLDVLSERAPGNDTATPGAMPAALAASALAGAIVERVDTPLVSAKSSAASELPATPLAARSGASAESISAAPFNAATRIRAVEATWVQVTDGRGQILLSRRLVAGEAVAFDSGTVLKVRIGNARGTEIVRHGQVVDLAPSTRDNIADLELR